MRWQLSALVKSSTWVSTQGLRLVSREHVLSLVDQVVVSGTAFLTTLLVARWSGPSQLGVYAVGISLLGFLLTCQDSLIIEPYLIQRHYPQGTTAERAGASLTLSILFSTGSLLALTIVAFGFQQRDAGSEMFVMTWAIAGVVPFALTRDFARRFSFAQLRFGGALLLDAAVALMQLSTLGWLGASGRMSALSAWGALGGACAFAAAGWLYSTRGQFAIRVRHVRTGLTETWALGKWLLAGQVTVQVQGNITYWLLIAGVGAAVTGMFAACMSIVAFANPLLQGLGNTLLPKMVLAWNNGGGPALRREAIRNTVLIAALVASFSLAVLFVGEHVMQLLYHGTVFEGHGHTLTVLALAMSAGAVGVPASFALATMERPIAIVTATTLGATLTIGLVWLFMTKWGLLGAAYGLLGGSVGGTVGRWAAFFFLVPQTFESARQLEQKTHEFERIPAA